MREFGRFGAGESGNGDLVGCREEDVDGDGSKVALALEERGGVGDEEVGRPEGCGWVELGVVILLEGRAEAAVQDEYALHGALGGDRRVWFDVEVCLDSWPLRGTIGPTSSLAILPSLTCQYLL